MIMKKYFLRFTFLHWLLILLYTCLMTCTTLALLQVLFPVVGLSIYFEQFQNIFNTCGFILIFIFGLNLIFLDGRFGPIWPDLKSDVSE